MAKLSLVDGSDSFEVTVLEATTKPSRVVLFAVGGSTLLSMLSRHLADEVNGFVTG